MAFRLAADGRRFPAPVATPGVAGYGVAITAVAAVLRRAHYPHQGRIMTRTPFLLITALATTLLVTPALSARAQSTSDAVTAQRFVGMWRLVSWNQKMADGTTQPSAMDQGYIFYSDAGRMCAVIMNSKRAKWAAGAPKTIEDAMARSAGQVAYCARVDVNAKEGFVLHHVDVERNPNIVGTIRKRWFTFETPDRLSLTIDRAELGANIVESKLVWERLRK